MDSHTLIGWILIGLIAGALASRLVEGEGLGCFMDIVVGIAGAIIGGAILQALAPDTHYRFLGSIVVAFIGASILLAVLKALGVGRRRSLPLGGRGGMSRRRGRWW